MRDRVDRLLPVATAVYEPERLTGWPATVRNDQVLRGAEGAAIDRLPPMQRRIFLAVRRGMSLQEAARDCGVPVLAAAALYRAATRRVQP